MGNSQDTIFKISQWADDVESLFHLFGFYEFLPHDDLIAALGFENFVEKSTSFYKSIFRSFILPC